MAPEAPLIILTHDPINHRQIIHRLYLLQRRVHTQPARVSRNTYSDRCSSTSFNRTYIFIISHFNFFLFFTFILFSFFFFLQFILSNLHLMRTLLFSILFLFICTSFHICIYISTPSHRFYIRKGSTDRRVIAEEREYTPPHS